jgi:hypothetical protein
LPTIQPRRYRGGGGGRAGEDDQKQPSAASSLFSGRGGAQRWCWIGRGGDEGARCTTAAQNNNGLPHACMHGRCSCLQKHAAVSSNEDRRTLASLGLLPDIEHHIRVRSRLKKGDWVRSLQAAFQSMRDRLPARTPRCPPELN